MSGNGKKVAVGMSGGLDSSVAAALLVEQGFEVLGLTAHMWKEGSRCCSLEDVERARKICTFLDIRHYVVNAQRHFEQRVVEPFVSEYVKGRTPSPCILCNEFIKFGFLLDRARQLDCDFLATGHYARLEERDGVFHLTAPADRQKDQTYFLHRLTQRQLAHSLFPLGDFTKDEAREWAAQRNLPVTSRGESQDLCFVEDGQYPQFVENRTPHLPKKGDIVTPDGSKVGEHDGVHRFTIGQRGGHGVALGERAYVSRLDADANLVELSPREGLMHRRCRVTDINWISGTPLPDGSRITLKPRYRHRGAEAVLHRESDQIALIEFKEDEFALTPGQAAVFYAGDELLGGGWISDPE